MQSSHSRFRRWALVGLLPLLALDCPRHEDPGPAPLDQTKLPDATEEGRNVLGCYVNGQLFLSVPVIDMLRRGLEGHVWGDQIFILADQNPVGQNQAAINIAFCSGFHGVGEYDLFFPDRTCGEAYLGYATTGKTYFADSLGDNKLIVTRYDSAQRILAGRFHFRGVTRFGAPDTLLVTDGRFDLRLDR